MLRFSSVGSLVFYADSINEMSAFPQRTDKYGGHCDESLFISCICPKHEDSGAGSQMCYKLFTSHSQFPV